MEIAVHADHAVVYPSGYLNGPVGREIDETCANLVRKGHSRIIINFNNIETINTMGIANLVSVLEKVGNRNGTVCFSNLLSTNRQMLDVLDISRAVLIFEDETQAREHLRERGGENAESSRTA